MKIKNHEEFIKLCEARGYYPDGVLEITEQYAFGNGYYGKSFEYNGFNFWIVEDPIYEYDDDGEIINVVREPVYEVR